MFTWKRLPDVQKCDLACALKYNFETVDRMRERGNLCWVPYFLFNVVHWNYSILCDSTMPKHFFTKCFIPSSSEHYHIFSLISLVILYELSSISLTSHSLFTFTVFFFLLVFRYALSSRFLFLLYVAGFLFFCIPISNMHHNSYLFHSPSRFDSNASPFLFPLCPPLSSSFVFFPLPSLDFPPLYFSLFFLSLPLLSFFSLPSWPDTN